ncbi:MAG: pirin family protein [Alphaproteobacteria bacterium]|nr:pirin family protein [Alphaproteobacteria bacterium]
MLTLRKATDRFHTKIDWLDSWHTFSFGHHRDHAHMGFGPLRVINDDIIAPDQGFDTHGHRDMEIITVVLSGALEHKDSLGTGSVIFPGDVQKMSAGKGILHSEFNASPNHPCQLLQIWIMPSVEGVKPEYQQISFDDRTKNNLCLVASGAGEEGVISLYQDAKMYVADMSAGTTLEQTLAAGRGAWVHVATGQVEINGQSMSAGDGAAISAEQKITFAAKSESKILLFDLAI